MGRADTVLGSLIGWRNGWAGGAALDESNRQRMETKMLHPVELVTQLCADDKTLAEAMVGKLERVGTDTLVIRAQTKLKTDGITSEVLASVACLEHTGQGNRTRPEGSQRRESECLLIGSHSTAQA